MRTRSTAKLSPTEIDVLRLVAQGMIDAEIADRLYMSPCTVHKHCNDLHAKTGSHNRVHLARYAVANNYVSVEWESLEK